MYEARFMIRAQAIALTEGNLPSTFYEPLLGYLRGTAPYGAVWQFRNVAWHPAEPGRRAYPEYVLLSDPTLATPANRE